MADLDFVETNLAAANTIDGIDQHLGPSSERTEQEPFGFYARVHDAPIAVPCRELLTRAKLPPSDPFYERFDLWLVPHRFSVLNKFGSAKIITAGCEVEYEDVGSLSIVSLFPTSQYVTEHPLDINAKIDASAILDQLGLMPATGANSLSDFVSAKVGLDLRNLALKFQFDNKLQLRVALDLVTPLVLASGVGSAACAFQFSLFREQLYGKDLETWAIVAVHKRKRELRYRMRVYYNARRFFLPRRWETAWVNVVAPRIQFNVDPM
jgi:hypothetical protein